MTNEDRLRAMRWAAATRLAHGIGDKFQRQRDRAALRLIDEELELAAAYGFTTRDAEGVALALEMQMAFDKLRGARPKEDEAPEFDGLSG